DPERQRQPGDRPPLRRRRRPGGDRDRPRRADGAGRAGGGPLALSAARRPSPVELRGMKPPTKALKALAPVLALLALALALAACGEKSETGGEERQQLSLTLDFYPNPDHAGIYMAQK